MEKQAQLKQVRDGFSGLLASIEGLEAKVVLGDIASWIEDPGAPLPSGADRRAAEVLAGGKREIPPEQAPLRAFRPGAGEDE